MMRFPLLSTVGDNVKDVWGTSEETARRLAAASPQRQINQDPVDPTPRVALIRDYKVMGSLRIGYFDGSGRYLQFSELNLLFIYCS